MKTDAGLTSRRMRCILKVAVVILLLALLAIPVFHQEIDDQSHFENILKAHGLIPDVIEDAPEAAILTVLFWFNNCGGNSCVSVTFLFSLGCV